MEQPTLIICVGEQLGEDFDKVANALGYKILPWAKGRHTSVNGASILWREDAITLQKLPSYHRTLHLRVTVLTYKVHRTASWNLHVLQLLMIFYRVIEA